MYILFTSTTFYKTFKNFILFSTQSPSVFFLLLFSFTGFMCACQNNIISYVYISLRRSISHMYDTNYIIICYVFVIFFYFFTCYSFLFLICLSLFSTTKSFYFPPKNISHILLLASLFDFNFLPEPVLYCILMLMLVLCIYILNMFQSIILTCWCSTINLRSS